MSNLSAKGDVSHLHSALEASGVNPQDLEALDGAINADGDAPYRSKVFGPKVSEWMGKMVQKAATGSWQVGIGAAGNLLATALSGYYGHG